MFSAESFIKRNLVFIKRFIRTFLFSTESIRAYRDNALNKLFRKVFIYTIAKYSASLSEK